MVRYDDKHLPRKAPFVLALIKLDGADTPFMHILEECPIEEVKIGMKVEAVFAKETTNTILDIDHFKPAAEKVSVHEINAAGNNGFLTDEPDTQEKRRGGRPDMSTPVIITAALTGAATMKNQNPSVPYTPAEFAEEAYKCWKAGAAMVHVHAREDGGMATHEHARIKATSRRHQGQVSGPDRQPELRGRHGQNSGAADYPRSWMIKPEMASLNTNTMNFGIVDRKTGKIFIDYVFENTFTMLQDFGKAMEENGVKPEIECYDMGGSRQHHA